METTATKQTSPSKIVHAWHERGVLHCLDKCGSIWVRARIYIDEKGRFWKSSNFNPIMWVLLEEYEKLECFEL